MSDHPHKPNQAGPDARRAWRDPLPQVRSPLAPGAVVDRLQRTSQQGKLPGFIRERSGSDGFEVTALGTHFDHRVRCAVGQTNEGSVIHGRGERPWRPIAVVWAIVILTLWPGVWITHSMLVTWFGWYRLELWGTAAWYVPLTLLAIPAVLKVQRASDVASWAHAHETLDLIARVCDGDVVSHPEAAAPPTEA